MASLRDRRLRQLVESGQTDGLSKEAIAAGLKEHERVRAELMASIQRTEAWAQTPLEKLDKLSPNKGADSSGPGLLGFLGYAAIKLIVIAVGIFILLGVIGILIFGIRQLF
jgi:hypothetical protein